MINSNATIVKVRKKSRNIRENESIKGKHFLTDSSNNLHECKGCSLGIVQDGSCIIYFSSSSASSLWTSHTNNSITKFKVNNLLEELIDIRSASYPIIQKVNIIQSPPSTSLFDLINQSGKFRVQSKKDSVIINDIEVKLVSPGLPLGNLLQVIDNIIQFCPNSTIIEIGSNQRVLQEIPSNPRKASKFNFAAVQSRINLLRHQKQIVVKEVRPKSKIPTVKTISWTNPLDHHPLSPLISNLNVGSANRWCKKVFNIIRTYIIHESSSVVSVFNESIDPMGLEILVKSRKTIKKSHTSAYSDLISFRAKILSGTLPTRKRLNELYPEQYPDQLCPRCSLRAEDINHVFHCQKTLDEIPEIINTINGIFNKDNNNDKPIRNIWQVVELSCGIISNIFSTSKIKNWIDASSEALSLLYNLIWKPRSNTANTAHTTGIKWTKKPTTKSKKNNNNNNNNNNDNNNNRNTKKNRKIQTNIPSSSISPNTLSSEVEIIELTKLVSETLVNNKFNFSNCISELIKSYDTLNMSR
jgi:hypothetical protein